MITHFSRQQLTISKFLFLLFLIVSPVVISSTSIDDDLKRLELPANQMPLKLDSEKMYVIQNRYSSLSGRLGAFVGGGKNFAADSFLLSNDLSLEVNYFLSDRFYLALEGGTVFNEMTALGNKFIETEHRAPDLAYAKRRVDLSLGFHLFYGKIRVSQNKVFYLDQYFSLGPAWIEMDRGEAWGATGDVGLSFWFGKHYALRLGLKDYFFKEYRLKSSGYAHHLIGHLDVGYLFGSGE